MRIISPRNIKYIFLFNSRLQYRYENNIFEILLDYIECLSVDNNATKNTF